ncbi:MAG TPA: hypothetical protein VNF24_10880, partial [Candidatus Acidoferrales bacterium]|nr:hypothetical protein [Candidatus Acidoferrales bacterium]
MDSTDAELITQATLDATGAHIKTITDNLSGLPESADPATAMTQVERAADAISQVISTWPAYESAKRELAPKELASMRSQLEQTKKTLDDIKARANTGAEEIRAQLQSVS